MTDASTPRAGIVSRLVERTHRVPRVEGTRGDGAAVARQLDAVLATVGFTCSRELLEHLATADPAAMMDRAVEVIDAVRRAVGDHVEHNAYFVHFPDGVPDTVDFWVECLCDAVLVGDGYGLPRAEAAAEVADGAINLLDLPSYGTYQHSFTDLVAAHQALIEGAGDRLTVLHVGGTVDEETRALYAALARSTTPLTAGDLELLAGLAPLAGNSDVGELPVRENRAAIDAVRAELGLPLTHAGTVTDVLRTATALSGGDPTLTEPTRFASLPRGRRRALLAALDRIVAADERALVDVPPRAEVWKRLGERLHAGEHADRYPAAARVFAVARGELPVRSPAALAEQHLAAGDPAAAARALAEAPGALARSADRLLRASIGVDGAEDAVLEQLARAAPRISGRVLLSLREHVENRGSANGDRLFVNRRGRAHTEPDARATPSPLALARVAELADAELARRVPAADRLVIDPDVLRVALPLSGKAAATGLAVVPRGTTMPLPAGDTLRFFTHWRQTGRRTDYDLSLLMLDADVGYAGQVSWTSLRDGDDAIRHSGDITEAEHGATEFIDVALDRVPADVAHLVPQVNVYAGEGFDDVAESLFGWMVRDRAQEGMPFEARTVRTRSEMRGRSRVALPAVFRRDAEGTGWSVTWLHLALGGTASFNRVEDNRVSTAQLVRSILARRYLTVAHIVEMRARTAATVEHWHDGMRLDEPVTYIGLERPDGLPDGSDVVTLNELSTLIPA